MVQKTVRVSFIRVVSSLKNIQDDNFRHKIPEDVGIKCRDQGSGTYRTTSLLVPYPLISTSPIFLSLSLSIVNIL